MSVGSLVNAVADGVAPEALSDECRKEECALSLVGAPAHHVLVDFDAPVLGLVGKSRADYLFIGEVDDQAWVAPIEMMGRRWDPAKAERQLQAGADFAASRLPQESSFRFCPIWARLGTFGKFRARAIRKWRVVLRGQAQQPVVIRCGGKLVDALVRS